MVVEEVCAGRRGTVAGWKTSIDEHDLRPVPAEAVGD